MISKLPCIAAAATLLAMSATHANAEDAGNWKKGRLYYRAVCTACHEAEAGGSISPATYTIQEWKDYLTSPEGADHVAPFVTQAYRESIAADNKVAAAFTPIPNQELQDDVRAFVIYGAKDSANPATCD